VTPLRVSWPQVLAWRTGQQLLREPAKTAVDVCRQVVGVQAQLMSAAELAIGGRSGRPPEDVRAALWSERLLVKTWAMRGTLHLLPADELPLFAAALRVKERAARRGAAWERYHGITVDQLKTAVAAIADVLGAEPVTREELAAEVTGVAGDAAVGEAVRESWGVVLKSVANEGKLCFGPDRGRNVTFVSPRAWVGGAWKEPPEDEAIRTVVHRFLDAYGPATSADLARWWGVQPAEGKRMLRPLTSDLVEVELDGTAAWLTAAGAEAVPAASPLRHYVRLLPAFDTYVFAPHGHRQHTWPEGQHDRVSRTAGWITPTLVVDGRVAGVWAYEMRGDGFAIEIEALVPLGKRQRAAAEGAARSYERLLRGPVKVTWAEGAAL
jgi:hypothetical protein